MLKDFDKKFVARKQYNICLWILRVSVLVNILYFIGVI